MSVCVRCQKDLPNPKRCSKCKTATYCGRECQTAHWKSHKKDCRRIVAEQDKSVSQNTTSPAQQENTASKIAISKPFTAISNNTFLHSLPTEQTYHVLIDCLRMKQEDTYAVDGEKMEGTTYNGEKTSETAFRVFLEKAKQTPGFLPPWWNDEETKKCVEFGLQKGHDFCLERAVKKHDIQKQWDDNMMPMKLRMLAEKVYGSSPGGQSGSSMLQMMVSQEQGAGPNRFVSHVQVGR